ncbi:beta-lactamase family protein [Porticoccaceae bacterium]|nr:beta-lactamase family protein [Porticoccaceae bacterium]MDA9559526.1 beta-lactamase family protein [Porticoccaceae bacterium]
MIKKGLAISLAILVLVAASLWYFFSDRIERVQIVSSLFTGVEQIDNFNRMHQMFPVTAMPAADQPYSFQVAESVPLPTEFSYGGKRVETEEFLARTDTGAVLVVKDGAIQFEQYWRSGGQTQTWLSMSVAKSFISALIGIAIEQGHIRDINDPITDYAPELAGSAYDNVAIKDILQMSSGASWNEDYSDPESDINRFARVFALGGSMNKFAITLTREMAPGTYNRYNSTDTQALGMLLTAATGRSITEYMIENLWHSMGAEHTGYWLTDADNMEMAFGGLNITARDYAKLGELYRLGGAFNGQQIVPADWVSASIVADAPHLIPGVNPASDWPLGYGYQWWIPEGIAGEFMAIGVYNQFIYIAPESNTVIVKLSANSAYGTPEDKDASSEFESIEFFRAIAGQP